MRYGKNRPHMKNKKEIAEIDKTGVRIVDNIDLNSVSLNTDKDLVLDFNINKTDSFTYTYEKDPIEEKVLSIILDKIKENEVIEEKKNKKGFKLYLNSIIDKIINKKNSLIKKIINKYMNWWRKKETNDLKDMISFVTIHGVLGAPVILSLLTITSIDLPIINLMREIKWINALLYIIGSGSAYYLFLDVNMALKETWRSKKK